MVRAHRSFSNKAGMAKPHREQDQIGVTNYSSNILVGVFSHCHSGRSREAVGDNRPRGMVIHSINL